MKSADIMAAFKRRWDVGPVGPMAPGGLWDVGQVPEGATSPYADLLAEEQERIESSGPLIQPIAVTIRVWTQPGAGAVDAGKLRDALAATFDWKQSRLHVAGATVLGVRNVTGGGIKTDAARKNASDVMIATGRWEVMIQIDRPQGSNG